MRVLFDERAAAVASITYPSFITEAITACRVSGLTFEGSLSARETVIVPTPASFATSIIVTAFFVLFILVTNFIDTIIMGMISISCNDGIDIIIYISGELSC